ncbi:MAG: hypothetical protein ACJ8KU_08000 [Chthoniobacterales bacterium]
MKLPNQLSVLALFFCALGVLIFVEVIRPFRDLSVDGPIALISWGIGAALGIGCLFLKGRSITLSVITVAANLLPLAGALLLLWGMSHTNFTWH